ncbi:MAG: hypothetical protein HY587_03820 [Candidatus Omnitrophica bacterium]|nr:hypothetical protein [Candidatus Omnitrophota bacterium]
MTENRASNEKRGRSFISLCAAAILAYGVAGGFVDGICSAAQAPFSIRGAVGIRDREGKAKQDHSGVVVFLDDLTNPPRHEAPAENAKISQVGKQFVPSVLPIAAGATVDFPNDDMVYHNVFSFSQAKSFDLGIYERGSKRSVTFDQQGLVKVYCNIHPQMVANILVLPNAFFSVTDSKGEFILSGVPRGEATVRTWHARSSEQPEQRIYVKEEGIFATDMRPIGKIEFQITEDRLAVKHKNKWGQDYPAKY